MIELSKKCKFNLQGVVNSFMSKITIIKKTRDNMFDTDLEKREPLYPMIGNVT